MEWRVGRWVRGSRDFRTPASAEPSPAHQRSQAPLHPLEAQVKDLVRMTPGVPDLAAVGRLGIEVSQEDRGDRPSFRELPELPLVCHFHDHHEVDIGEHLRVDGPGSVRPEGDAAFPRNSDRLGRRRAIGPEEPARGDDDRRLASGDSPCFQQAGERLLRIWASAYVPRAKEEDGSDLGHVRNNALRPTPSHGVKCPVAKGAECMDEGTERGPDRVTQ